jgi:CubicO group peptidase (beta-lactamase class C family)
VPANLQVKTFFALVLSLSVTACSASAQKSTDFPLSNVALKQTMAASLEAFHTPSVSVAIVYKGKLVFNDAQGLASIEKSLKADKDTYYRLASVSKAFTAAALGVLVDQGKLDWSDKVIQYLPEFVMQDPWVTREFTIKDLLSHKSGLVGGAGDSMIWPEPSGFTRDEVVHNLRYLTPEYSFRNRYAYSNVLYITAGQLIARVSGMTFDEFVDKHVFAPLNMHCFAGELPQTAMSNVAMSYGHNDTKGIYAIPRNRIHGQALMSSAAGGMVCNTHEMSKWLMALLDNQEDQSSLPFSQGSLDEMWSPQTILSVSDIDEEWDGTLFRHYGLGWRISNLYEHKVISHTGTLSGYQAYLSIIPDFDLGVIILNNGSNYGVRGAVMQTIIKAVLADHKGEQYAKDWVQTYIEYQKERELAYLARNIEAPVGNKIMVIDLDDIVGAFTDQWFGTFEVYQHDDGKTRIRHSKMKTLVGTVVPFENTRFKVEWDNSNAQNDAFMHFDLDVNGEILGMSMHPFVSATRSAHEYRDMYFKPAR